MLVYLDHNILDSSLKGRISDLPYRIKQTEGYPIYSKENLIEIRRSTGHELDFLRLLGQLDARYLDLETTLTGSISGRYVVRPGDPIRHFEALVETLDEIPYSGFGLEASLQKMYGGLKNKSFKEISLDGLARLLTMLDGAMGSIDEIDELSIEQRDVLRAQFEYYRQTAIDTMPKAGVTFDEQSEEVSAASFERAVGIGPKQLNNIRPPDVIRKIWTKLDRTMPNNPGFSKLFGLEVVVASQRAPESMVEKVNAIYNALNFFGYYRDKGMKDLRRITASLSDTTHAGYASVCDWLFSSDEDLVRKAEAAYEYLQVPTRILYIQP